MSPGSEGPPVNRAEFLARLRQGTSGTESVEPPDDLQLNVLPRFPRRVEGILQGEQDLADVDPEDLYKRVAGQPPGAKSEISDQDEDGLR